MLVGDQPVHPVLERVVGAHPQHHPVDVPVTRDAGLGLSELEEGDDRARVALLVAEVGVVAERRLEVERVLDEPQTHHAAPEVDVGRHVARDAREVMRTLDWLLHACSSRLSPPIMTPIPTTHVGSLPRPDDLIRTMFAKQEGVPVDPVALEQRTGAAVHEVVAKQLEAGVDVISDGEMGKPSYVTYIADRLDGFGGTSQPLTYADLVEFPNLQKKVFGDPGRSRRRTPACDAPITVRDPGAARADIEHLLAARGDSQAFMNAASPGVIALFFRNDHYATREEYLFAIADAMRVEYEAITEAGLLVQIDCPDLGMGRHIQFADLDLDGFREEARLNLEALNHATR